ncbi:restriction endonuclease subunit M [Flavobacterium sp.]|uniref:restriction endonuclease subunit M n=1 Tax=Flavobacterium sp. TaxID=239 RepID=UPI004047857B
MQKVVDIIEDKILDRYPNVLEILLQDKTTNKNIFWATDNYENLGNNYSFPAQITIDLITGRNGNIIMPRVLKDKLLQQSRVKNMAEVFTPSWVCNEQNNAIDNAWFQRENVFNKIVYGNDGSHFWKVNTNKINFPSNKNWIDYVCENRLEVSCGEAPYLTSRYDTTTGKFIPIKNRIGILDRKLRVISENTEHETEWLEATYLAYKSTYGYEWQGDSLLLARESLLYTFIECFLEKFGNEPNLNYIEEIAIIISWNLWQMDGLKGIIPDSCKTKELENENLFGDSITSATTCIGCKTKNIKKHNGIYCEIIDWNKEKNIPIQNEKKIRFIDLIQN